MLKKEQIKSFKENVDVVEIENHMEAELLKEEIEQRKLKNDVQDQINSYIERFDGSNPASSSATAVRQGGDPLLGMRIEDQITT